MRKKVLLIDDSVTIHKIVDLTIDRYSFELLSAYDIDEGLNTSSAETPALILIDNKLFTHTTEDALMELRSGNPNVGIVLLVGAYDHSETELEHTIVDDYIVKPFNSGTLNQVLTDILAKRGEPVENSQAVAEPTMAVIDGLEAVTDTEDVQEDASGQDAEPTMLEISDEEPAAAELALPSLEELPDFSNDDLVETAESLLTHEEAELADEELEATEPIDEEIIEEPVLEDVPLEEPVIEDVFADSKDPIADELSPEALAAIDSLADEDLTLEEPVEEAELSLDDLALDEPAAEPAAEDELSLDDLALEEPSTEAEELSLDDLALEGPTAEEDEPSLDDLVLAEPTLDDLALAIEESKSTDTATEPADLEAELANLADEPSLDDLALEESTQAEELSLDDLTLEEPTLDEEAEEGLPDQLIEAQSEDEAAPSASNAMADMFDMMDESGDDSPISEPASDPIDEMLDTPAIAPEEDIFSNNQALSQVDNLMLADEEPAAELEPEAVPENAEPKDAVFGDNAGLLEGDERQELSTMFNDLNLSAERGEDDEDEGVIEETTTPAMHDEPTIAEPTSSVAEPASSIMAQVTQEVTINQSEPVAKLVLELSKQDLIKLLEASVGKDVLEKIMKEVLQDSISDVVEKLVPNLAEKLVREELKIIKGE